MVATTATGTITARLAWTSETALLDLAPQSALLVELRVLFDQEGQVFERTETRYVADRYVIDVVHTAPRRLRDGACGHRVPSPRGR